MRGFVLFLRTRTILMKLILICVLGTQTGLSRFRPQYTSAIIKQITNRAKHTNNAINPFPSPFLSDVGGVVVVVSPLTVIEKENIKGKNL